MAWSPWTGELIPKKEAIFVYLGGPINIRSADDMVGHHTESEPKVDERSRLPLPNARDSPVLRLHIELGVKQLVSRPACKTMWGSFESDHPSPVDPQPKSSIINYFEFVWHLLHHMLDVPIEEASWPGNAVEFGDVDNRPPMRRTMIQERLSLRLVYLIQAAPFLTCHGFHASRAPPHQWQNTTTC